MPRLGDVAIKTMALVLREDDDPEITGIDKVREHEVNQPVVAAKWHRRLGTIEGQGGQALAFPTRQDHGEYTHAELLSRLKPEGAGGCTAVAVGLAHDRGNAAVRHPPDPQPGLADLLQATRSDADRLRRIPAAGPRRSAA